MIKRKRLTNSCKSFHSCYVFPRASKIATSMPRFKDIANYIVEFKYDITARGSLKIKCHVNSSIGLRLLERKDPKGHSLSIFK